MEKEKNRFSDSQCIVFEKKYNKDEVVANKLFEPQNYEVELNDDEIYSLLGEDDE